MFWKVFLTGVALVTMASAQGGDPGMGGMGGSGASMNDKIGSTGKETGGVPAGGQMGRVQKETKADMVVSRLKLNKDQTNELITILTSAQKDSTSLIQQVMETRQQYASALIDGKGETDLAPIVKAMGEAQFEMTGVEVKTFQRILGILKPNQKAKAPEAFDLMGDIFMPTGMPGGGGRRAGNGGGGR